MKRFIAILLCAVMLCGLVPAFAVQASQTGQSTDYMGFSDLKGHWAEEALTHAVENGLLKGYDGKLSPNDALTRAQLATIVVSAFGATEKADISHLTDVSKDAWYYTYVQKAVAMGALKGDEGGTFRPEDKVSREEAFTVFDSLLMLGSGNTSVLNSFTDADQVSGWARPMVSDIVEAGLAVGNQGKLNPKSSITRAEFATIIYRAISEYGRSQSITLDKADSLAVTAPNAVVKGTKVTGDLYITEGVGDTEIVLDGVTVGGRLVIRSGSVIILKNGASISGKTIILDGLDAQVKVVVGRVPAAVVQTWEQALKDTKVPEEVKQYIRFAYLDEYQGVNFKVIPNVIPVGDGFNTSIFDSERNLWLGTDTGILIISEDGNTTVTISETPEILPYDKVTMLFSDGATGAWVICGDPATDDNAVCHIQNVI